MGLFNRRPARQILDPDNQAYNNANALTASGFRVRRMDGDIMRRLIQPWQARAFAYYDLLGEIKYASQFYARMLSPLKLYAAEIDENGDIVETTDKEAIDALERIQDPGGGRTGLLASYGRLMFLTGECYLFVSTDPETGIEQWEMLSTDELRVISGGVYQRYKAPSLLVEEYREPNEPSDQEGAWVPQGNQVLPDGGEWTEIGFDRKAVAYRLWQRHPRWSMLADSTMQGVLDLCEELILLTQAVRARARSRLAGSGILLIDERISPPPLEPTPDEDPNSDPFMRVLIRTMTAPITNEGAASQIVPLVLRVTAPENGKVEDLMTHLQLIDPTQLYPETGLRYEIIKRIAIGLDMPPEILLGLETSNHWTAWQIDEQTWKGHGQPKAVQLCDDLTSAYFRPYLREVLKKADWAKYVIAFDASEIINHPDRTSDAKDLFDRVALSHEALRTAAGFTEDDAPDEQERAERIGILTRDSSLAWFGTPAPRGGAVETAPGEITSDQPGDATAGPPGPATGGEVEKNPPSSKNGTGPEAPPPEAVVGALVARIMGAADLGLLRAREAAGNRIVSLAKRDPELRELLRGVPTGQVAAKLGRIRVRALKAPLERELVHDAQGLIVDACRQWNLDPAIGRLVAEHVERQAAATLYDERPAALADTFAAYIAGLIQQAPRGVPARR